MDNPAQSEGRPSGTVRRYHILAGNMQRHFSLERRNRTKETVAMKTFSKITSALALAATGLTSVALSSPADARHHYRHHHYYGRTYYHGRYCRYSSGTTGLVAGGVGGAVVGSKVIGGPVGAIAGAVGGAVAGRAIDRASTAPRRCYYR
jgi:hypothetical protein